MASIDTLLDFVMPRTPHLTVELARLELRQAAILFCRRSKADRRTLTDFNTVAGTAFYTLTPPSNAAMVEVMSVSLDGEDPGLEPLRSGQIPRDAAVLTDTPKWFSATQNGTQLQLIYAPDDVYAVQVQVAVEPSLSSTTIEDAIASRYGMEIAHGALERLFLIPKKPWTDPSTAAYHKTLFDQAIQNAKDEAEQGFTAAATRTRPTFGLR
jgi:hypothetical protein